MDRDELQARIRARRSGQPYRRGAAMPPRTPAEPWDGERDVEEGDQVDDTRQWAPPVPVAQSPAPPQRGYQAPDVVYEDTRYPDPQYEGNAAWSPRDHDIESTDARYELPGHVRRERRGAPGAPFLVGGLVVLGAIALLGGAALAGMITRRGDTAGVGAATAIPSASAAGPVATASPGPVASATPSPAGTAGASATPRFFFEDGFTAAAEPCLVQPTQTCPAPGAVVPPGNSTVWILVTFEQIRGGDLIGVHGVGPDGVGIGDASWPAPAGGSGPANGHAFFGFSIPGFPEGEYEVTVTRNGEPAAITTFRIEG